MKTEGTNLLLLTISAFWSQGPPRWAPEGREVSHKLVVIDRFHCNIFKMILLISDDQSLTARLLI